MIWTVLVCSFILHSTWYARPIGSMVLSPSATKSSKPIACTAGPIYVFLRKVRVNSELLYLLLQSSLAIPYALSLLEIQTPPSGCNVLGLAYVIALTVSMFNLLAIILSDAYIFYEENVAEVHDDKKGALTCLFFGITTIYIGSIILHLGPTLIGGEFRHNEAVGNCTFAYGKVQVRGLKTFREGAVHC